jgi:hypothetical protein
MFVSDPILLELTVYQDGFPMLFYLGVVMNDSQSKVQPGIHSQPDSPENGRLLKAFDISVFQCVTLAQAAS